jgi:hypothetical protein
VDIYWRRDRADHSAANVGFVLNFNLVVASGVRENRTVRCRKLRVETRVERLRARLVGMNRAAKAKCLIDVVGAQGFEPWTR